MPVQPWGTANLGVSFSKVLEDEKCVICKQREKRNLMSMPARQLGLALSGGGIRSAAFALGVLQKLQRKDKLKEFDYLSTVSGGGYIGSSLTWFNFLQRGEKNHTFPFGLKSFVRREVSTDKMTSAEQESLAKQRKEDNTAFLRQQGEFLRPSMKITTVSLAAVVLRNAVVSFSVYFALVVAGTLWVLQNHAVLAPLLPRGEIGAAVSDAMMPAVLLALLFALLSILFGLLTWFFPKFQPSGTALYRMRIDAQRWLGWALAWTIAAFILGSIEHVYAAIGEWRTTGVTLTATTGLTGLAFEFVKQQRPRIAAAWPKLSGLAVWVGAFAMIYAVLLGAYALAVVIEQHHHGDARWLLYLLGYAVLVGGFMNSNLFGIGRMYRDRLMETFLPDPESVQERRWRPAERADATFLQDVCTEQDFGPYHLINANVVLPGTDYAAYRGRGGDNFILSSRYSGSEATGWHPTDKFCGGTMSLATAMAISGAAISPNAACGGQGPTRNRLASFMLALFNVRLGYWVRNPRAPPARARLLKLLWPNLLYPGLRQGLLGTGLDERAGFIELTDGGHFDNTGLYELIRRRVDVIVLSLASADPDYGFDDLADVIERVRVDFGAYVELAPASFQGVIPNAQSGSGIAAALRLSKAGHVFGTIEYLDKKFHSDLIILKSVALESLPLDTLRYAARHSAFPNESTADQFFEERQFEAYREAGYEACRGMLGDSKAAHVGL